MSDSLPTVPATIIEQLGGARIFAMAFAARTFHTASAITLEIVPALRRGAKGKATHVCVILEPSDTYTVRVTRRSKVKGVTRVAILSTDSDVYAESLRSLIESRTGLYLSL